MWQVDYTPLDLWILDERSQPAKPWLIIVLDDYSRAVVGYALSLHAPSSIQTALALRQAIWRRVYCTGQCAPSLETLESGKKRGRLSGRFCVG